MSLNILLSVSSIAHPVKEEFRVVVVVGGGNEAKMKEGRITQKLFILEGGERGKTRTSEGE